MLKKYRKLQRSPDGPFSQVFIKPVELLLLPVVVRLPVSPHVWTGLSFLTKIAAGLWICSGFSYLYVPLWLAGALVLDGFDGDVARWRGQSSFLGAYLDRGLDRVANCFILACFLLRLMVRNSNPSTFYLGAFFLVTGEILHETLRVWISLTGGLLEKNKTLPAADRWLRNHGILPFYAQDSLYFLLGLGPFILPGIKLISLLGVLIWLSFFYLLKVHWPTGKDKLTTECRSGLLRLLINRFAFFLLLAGGGIYLQEASGYFPAGFWLFSGWAEFIGFYLGANYLMSLSARLPDSDPERNKFINKMQKKDRNFLRGWLP